MEGEAERGTPCRSLESWSSPLGFGESLQPEDQVDEVTFPSSHWPQPEFWKRGEKRGTKIKLGKGKVICP